MEKEPNMLKVAAAQATPFYLNQKQTVDKACNLILEASKKGAKLIVFPEVFISGYPDWVWVVPNSHSAMLNDLYAELIQNSVTVPSETTNQLCEAAKEAEINVAIGMHERNAEASNASLFNTLLFIDSNGNILGKHRKLVPTGGERLIWAQGNDNSLQAYHSTVGKIGGLICWENYMPLARQAVYESGTQVLAAPTWDKSENWLLSLRHIAREGGMYVIGCCMAIRMDDIPDRFKFKKFYPEGREWINTGNSCIINPKGEFIAGPIEKKEEIIYAEIDHKLILDQKRIFDAAGHYSRPDVFKFLVNQTLNKDGIKDTSF